jgi:16S rRNA (guanine(966)-N(2))-methyltransferase RsmD
VQKFGLRVISGTAKGRKLRTLPGKTTRPVTDRVKEALFDILGGDVVRSRWWDLFGGTGAIGIEAISRGAAFVRFTEVDAGALDVLRWNVDRCGFQAESEIVRRDVFGYLGQAPDQSFDYLYVAPPQYHGLWLKTLTQIDRQPGWLSSDGWAIVQIDPKEVAATEGLRLDLFDERRYGKTLLRFYRRPG